jgi:hypothetical protein
MPLTVSQPWGCSVGQAGGKNDRVESAVVGARRKGRAEPLDGVRLPFRQASSRLR